MNNKRLSIIIPFYNVEQYIAQCLDSVYHQDIPEEEYEVICVDDCSPDNSISIVEEYARKHTNLVIVRNQYNRKLGGARNAGMDVATGQYIWFVDSDDFVENNCFQKLLTIAESENLDVLHFNYSEYPDDKNPLSRPPETHVLNGPDMFFHSDFIWFHDLVTAWRKIYKHSFLVENKIEFAEHIMFEDNDYAISVFAYANRVRHISNVYYHYRCNPMSITRVNYTIEHVKYWLNLSKRLHVLWAKFLDEKKDERFDSLFSDFIKYTITNVIMVSQSFEYKYRKEICKLISKDIDIYLKPYISKQNYLKIKLGIL